MQKGKCSFYILYGSFPLKTIKTKILRHDTKEVWGIGSPKAGEIKKKWEARKSRETKNAPTSRRGNF